MKLKVIKDGVELHNVDLATAGRQLILGRAEGADIRLDDRAVGREHALFLVSSGGVSVQKKSKFGRLSVNGAETSEAVLKPGDVISIADFLVRIEEGTVIRSTAAVKPSNEVTQPEGIAADQAPDLATVPEGNTPPLGQTLEAIPVDGNFMAGHQGIETAEPMQLGEPGMESPAMESQPEESIKMEAPMAEAGGELPEMQMDNGFAAEGGDRTAMISVGAVDCELVFNAGEANVERFKLNKPEIAIGRGSTCDIVITDKKSSRKHLVIKRVGINYVAVDQGSANGTSVNGVKISEQELAGDDVIKIGDTEFTFRATSQEYMQQEAAQEFIAPPTEEEPQDGIDQQLMSPGMMGMPQAGSDGQVPMQGGDPAGSSDPTLGGIPGLADPNAPKKKQTLIEKFKAQPKPRQAMILGVIGLVMVMAMQDDEPVKKPQPKPTPTATAGSSADAMFNALPEEKKQFVMNTYQLALDLYKKGEYEKSIYEIEKVHQVLVNGYRDSFEIKKYAQKSVEIQKAAEEEERRKKAEEKMRKEVQEFVAAAEAAVAAGREAEAKELFAKVLERDPENPSIMRLRQQLEEKENQRKAAEEAAREKEMKQKSLEASLQEGRDLLKAGKYYEVIEKMSEAIPIFAEEELMKKEAQQLIEEARHTLRARTKPHLDAGKAAFDSGDYLVARDHFYKALAVDSRSGTARRGLSQIREILHERSRRIYIDAITAESVSDYKTAKIKFKECLDSAMREDTYYGRCLRKYKRFELVDRATASDPVTSQTGAPSTDPAPPKLPSPVDVDASSGDPAPPAHDVKPELPSAAEAPASIKPEGAGDTKFE